MILLGRVKGQRVDKARNVQSGKVRLLQVALGSNGHVQSPQLVPQAGEDYCPPNEATALCVRIGRRLFVLATFDGIEPSVAPGERKLYSTSGGAIKASVHLKADGSVVVDGGQITIQGSASVTLKTGDGSLWKPNILPNDPMTGVPHGGPTAGITKLKGA